MQEAWRSDRFNDLSLRRSSEVTEGADGSFLSGGKSDNIDEMNGLKSSGSNSDGHEMVGYGGGVKSRWEQHRLNAAERFIVQEISRETQQARHEKQLETKHHTKGQKEGSVRATTETGALTEGSTLHPSPSTFSQPSEESSSFQISSSKAKRRELLKMKRLQKMREKGAKS